MSLARPPSEARSSSDHLTAVRSLAVSVFNERSDPDYLNELGEWADILGIADPVLRDFHRHGLILSHRHQALESTADKLFSTAELRAFARREGELDPMVLHAGGGSRVSPTGLLTGLLSSAFLHVYSLRLPRDETTFVRTVLEGFEELHRAARGERVRAYLIFGIGGVKLADERQVSTPWGVMRPAPPTSLERSIRVGFQPVTRCLLAESRLVTVKFDRAESPQETFDSSEIAADSLYLLLPLACSLASSDTTEPAAPLVTWSTVLLPFQGATGYGIPFLPSRWRPEIDVTSQISEIEEWSRIVESSHARSVDVAARRLVSAIAHRIDRGDALIDAVIVWENIVGTSTETTFRVTAALAKALQPDRTKRRSFRKTLGRVYTVRSSVVHGAAVDPAKIDDAASKAIDVALRILAFSYKRGRAWLSLDSTTRADALLLEDP